ncbi:MAG TPA: prepilin peptidase [Bryobacteraceae bacterium]|nr:prepilin peptidase [Bryobacteraceae bacterium]
MIEAILAGLFGLIIGSFLNVCVFRMPRDISVANPKRSFCPHCDTEIAWYDNIPVVSYAVLGGRCRSCRAGIPLRYPLVELFTGLAFFGVLVWLGPTLEAVKYCAFAAIQIALIAMDLEERILADEFTKGGIALGLIFAAFVPMPMGLLQLVLPQEWPVALKSVAESAFAASLLSGILWSIGWFYEKIRRREGLGFGDVKMVGMIGAFLGLGPALLTVVMGSVMGSVVGLLFIFLTRKDAHTYELPFGSFLGLAAMLVAVWVRSV